MFLYNFEYLSDNHYTREMSLLEERKKITNIVHNPVYSEAFYKHRNQIYHSHLSSDIVSSDLLSSSELYTKVKDIDIFNLLFWSIEQELLNSQSENTIPNQIIQWNIDRVHRNIDISFHQDYRKYLEVVAHSLLFYVDIHLLTSLSLSDNSASSDLLYAIYDKNLTHQDQSIHDTIISMHTVYKIHDFSIQSSRNNLKLDAPQIVLLLFSIIDNCNPYRFIKLIQINGYQPFELINRYLIGCWSSNDSKYIYTGFVCGLRKRIASYLRDRSIVRAIINMRHSEERPISKTYQPNKYTIVDFPDEILCSLYSIYHPDLHTVKLIRALIVLFLDNVSAVFDRIKRQKQEYSHSLSENIFNRSYYDNRINYCEYKINRLDILTIHLKDLLASLENLY